MQDCRFVSSRNAIIALLPKGGVIAELGVLRGDFSATILETCAPVALHLIDLNTDGIRADVREDARTTLHKGFTSEGISSFEDAYFDWIYIDADHSYAGVQADIRASASKIKPGGYMIFNDFAMMDPYLGIYGVHRAAIEFAVSAQWQLAYLSYNPFGLYDLALRKPEKAS